MTHIQDRARRQKVKRVMVANRSLPPVTATIFLGIATAIRPEPQEKKKTWCIPIEMKLVEDTPGRGCAGGRGERSRDDGIGHGDGCWLSVDDAGNV